MSNRADEFGRPLEAARLPPLAIYPPGTRFGRYRICRHVSSGGMAQVYLADMLHTDDTPLRPVAMKLIHLHLAQDPNFLQKFEYEARLGGRLIHENIVQLLDYDNHTLGQPFLVMEYVEGATLDQIISWAAANRQPLPLATSLHLVEQLLQGLSFAHELQDPVAGRPLHVLHRDLKPSNILVNWRGVAKIADFGIARAADRPFETDGGLLHGTASYMAPEHLKGARIQGPPLDLWAVGVILYELITLKPLFTGSVAQVISKIVLEDLGPRLRALTDAPASLVDILRHLLAQDVVDRYQSAREVLADLAPLIRQVGTDPQDWQGVFEAMEEDDVTVSALITDRHTPAPSLEASAPTVLRRERLDYESAPTLAGAPGAAAVMARGSDRATGANLHGLAQPEIPMVELAAAGREGDPAGDSSCEPGTGGRSGGLAGMAAIRAKGRLSFSAPVGAAVLFGAVGAFLALGGSYLEERVGTSSGKLPERAPLSSESSSPGTPAAAVAGEASIDPLPTPQPHNGRPAQAEHGRNRHRPASSEASRVAEQSRRRPRGGDVSSAEGTSLSMPQKSPGEPVPAFRLTTRGANSEAGGGDGQVVPTEPADSAPGRSAVVDPVDAPGRDGAPPAQAHISVQSRPAGRIILDGQEMDSQDLDNWPVPPGRHRITLLPSSRVYEPVSFDVDLKAGQSCRRLYDFRARDWIVRE